MTNIARPVCAFLTVQELNHLKLWANWTALQLQGWKSWNQEVSRKETMNLCLAYQARTYAVTVQLQKDYLKEGCFWGDRLAQWLERWTGYKGRGFESHQEHTKNFEFFRVKKVVLTRCRCAQLLCVYERIRSCSPCQSLMDYGNTKIPSMHLYP